MKHKKVRRKKATSRFSKGKEGGEGHGKEKGHGKGQLKTRVNRSPRDKGETEFKVGSEQLATYIKRTQEYLHQHLPNSPIKAPKSSADHSLALDDWQQEAFELLSSGNNLVVDAPTTAGKTRIVEVYFRQFMENPGFRAAYTTPVKSLSNDKVREFREMFGHGNVGIATGDIKENLNAPIVVATLESYRNSLLGIEPDLGRKLVVFDEYHFVQDQSRGSAWEEAIILSPPSTQLLLLSASVDNPHDFCRWLEAIKPNPCRVIEVKHRPVPLENFVFYQNQWLLAKGIHFPKTNPQDPLLKFPLSVSELASRLVKIEALNLTPCIVYAGGRLACETIVEQLIANLSPIPKAHAEHLKSLMDKLDLEYDCYQFLPRILRKAILVYGIAYHHSGLGPGARLIVESLLKAGELRFCSATMGLSIGINFAVRSAIMSDYRRPGSQGYVTYEPSEVLQMLGRAGRRGRDLIGFSLWPNYQSFQKFIPAKREKVFSQLRNDPSTFLGLSCRGLNLKQIEVFYQESFLKFKDHRADLRVVRKEQIARQLNITPPCESPAAEFARYGETKKSMCSQCPHIVKCHKEITDNYKGNLSLLHLHLHKIKALSNSDGLTPFGDIARFFPQAGGLVVAEKILIYEIEEKSLMAGIELMASLTLARFKEPNISPKYRFSFDEDQIEQQLEAFYPEELFPELYDPPFGRRRFSLFREYDPRAGYIVREWLMGREYKDLVAQVCHEKFAPGDLINTIYRTASFLQSLGQTQLPNLSQSARNLWQELMRPPLRPQLAPLKRPTQTHESDVT